MLLPRTQNALKESRDHITCNNAEGTSIESYLTQHILILLSSEMQNEIYSLLRAKAKQVNQMEIREFISNAGKICVRGVKKEAISGFLGYFGTEYKQKFNKILSSKEREIAVYGNAITNRDTIAHRGGAQVTFREIESAVDSAKLILSAVQKILEVDDNQNQAEK